MPRCARCQGVTKDGKQCRNKIACDLGCSKYCHVHSVGYQKSNKYCVKPKYRHSTRY